VSHLFSQGLVSAQSLLAAQSKVHEEFVAAVAGAPHGRDLSLDFRPKKVVFAILMPEGKELIRDTLFPFPQVTLAHTARTLGRWSIDVEVIGIPAA
jgi:uncharacterized protein (TIGR04141 family)